MKIKIKTSQSISENEVEFMYNIYKDSYNTSRIDFNKKKNSIDTYALYYTNEMKLVGFTGIRDKGIRIEKKKYNTLYIGQTIILKEYRGKSLIQRTVFRLFLKYMFKNPLRPIIVWNDSLTYRPYLVIAKKVKQFYPNPNPVHNGRLEKVRNAVGSLYYGDAFCSKTGVVTKNQIALTQQELAISPERMKDPYVRFYVDQNPQYTQGNGLITLCPANLNNAIYYLIGQVIKRNKN